MEARTSVPDRIRTGVTCSRGRQPWPLADRNMHKNNILCSPSESNRLPPPLQGSALPVELDEHRDQEHEGTHTGHRRLSALVILKSMLLSTPGHSTRRENRTPALGFGDRAVPSTPDIDARDIDGAPVRPAARHGCRAAGRDHPLRGNERAGSASRTRSCGVEDRHATVNTLPAHAARGGRGTSLATPHNGAASADRTHGPHLGKVALCL